MDNENKNQDKNQNGEIIFNIDVMLAKRKMSVTELAERVGITITNMSILKNLRTKTALFPFIFSKARKLISGNAARRSFWIVF